MGDAETEYYVTNAIGKYLDLTVWGQMARLLDTSGTLAAIGSEDAEIVSRKPALFKTFGLSSLEGKMKKILDSTQTQGDAFQIAGGRYQLVVKDWVGRG